uniref:Uncharacterized protein n=1 Tax=Panthera tigris altaica TaxID=74533 RepID=A0A8C9KBD0_PANTA
MRAGFSDFQLIRDQVRLFLQDQAQRLTECRKPTCLIASVPSPGMVFLFLFCIYQMLIIHTA